MTNKQPLEKIENKSAEVRKKNYAARKGYFKKKKIIGAKIYMYCLNLSQ